MNEIPFATPPPHPSPTRGEGADRANRRTIHVAAAAIQSSDGKILLARRPDHTHQGGLWEFPGGKLEPGESLAEGLRRELHEEVGIEIIAHRPLICVTHTYKQTREAQHPPLPPGEGRGEGCLPGDRTVRLDVHLVTAYRGAPHGKEGQPIAWVEPERLHHYPMPAADGPIVSALRLPDRYLITGPDPHRPDEFLGKLERAIENGVRLVQFRTALEPSAGRTLAARALQLCRANGVRMLVNGAPELALEIGADGVHLNSRRLIGLAERPLPADLLVAASCHDAAELSQAERLGCDFALLSPVLPTASHPDAAPLGWERFAERVEPVAMPVYALGGMTPALIETAWSHGAQGIAAIRGLWPEGPGRI